METPPPGHPSGAGRTLPMPADADVQKYSRNPSYYLRVRLLVTQLSSCIHHDTIGDMVKEETGERGPRIRVSDLSFFSFFCLSRFCVRRTFLILFARIHFQAIQRTSDTR